ncbi:bifunctional UDP-N-acetylmuramoyl-tripeptide:D-alanyl-D-alanine ligase/alanine racemase [Taibaiella soli]|uniref:Alanine racemase n=1 Tax=Taibaiella soli TaxID=1649169 RepID=A0A2W2BWQ3_9BACT|nr:bifunctional UDP-N-acetylmuramoyl-tripeptide:D-alanyl-D-alanine ligase/alanine racemase [Taibaiella soli]PZF72283.1 bifunctional UDP-N-acetylmuramoyl-tripeptide:D-alanyl-D-alanine ligase/alanine racemase [Taibaiella soli]
MLAAQQICAWSQGTWMAFHADIVIEELIIDSRKINEPETALFIALKAPRRDGHSFIASAYDKGVRNFLVQEEINTSDYPGANFILVKDTLKALQLFVAQYRKQFSIPVIGITGSNGKTVVKEWLFQLLSNSFSIARSPKSYNSQIGVPLSVWLLEPENELGIFEAGISQPGEMENLERIIKPDIGIFTNIGEAHSEGFMNLRQKINEKLILFRNAKQLIYCSDHPELNEAMAQYIHQIKGNGSEPDLQLFTWSQKHEADLRITRLEQIDSKTKIEGQYQGVDLAITIPFTDPASVENAIHCWCTLLLLKVPQQEIEKQMEQLHTVAMRLELRHGINDSTLINDTYNSDLTSLYIALDYLEQQKQHNHRTVILSDMLQIGKPDMLLYEEVAEAIARRNIQRFIGIGPALYKSKSLFRAHKKLRSIFFKSTEEFIKKLHLVDFDKDAILLKGARSFRFEKVSILLEQEVHQTVLSIDLSAMMNNLNVFRTRVAPGVKVMAMVKAFSYGSGSYEVAYALQYAGVDYLTVAYTDEGIALRKAGISLPIMVMSPDSGSFDRMIAWKLEPEIFNLRSLELFTRMAQTMQVKEYPIHIKLDTGMHRLGFMVHELPDLFTELAQNEHVKVASVFSHLAGSEDAGLDEFTRQQAAAFRSMSDSLTLQLGYKPYLHLCNSAGIARHPELHFDMVRLGLGLYGVDGSGVLHDELIQVGTLKTTIAQIKELDPGETVGYNRRGKVDHPMRIATISIGYADGYPRALGNGTAHVLIHDKPAKLVGVVCMDMCMVDVTGIPEAKEGDEVIVFGRELPLTQLSQWADTIPYEMMTGISQRVKRVYVNEG